MKIIGQVFPPLWRLHMSIFWKPHFILDSKKVEVELKGWLLKTMRVDMEILILIEKVNRNYRLLLKRLHGRRVLENEDFRKQHCIDDSSDGEHHQHMVIDCIRIIEEGQQ